MKKVLVLRYGTNVTDDCISKHIDVEQDLGYCWFGKLGRYPAKKVLDEIMSGDSPQVILYSRVGAFLCNLLEITDKKPDVGYPSYYNEFLFDKNILQSMYFKLSNIMQM